ncbi:tyrosine-protein phosphatase [Confluentibacter flavum]|uniref:protein-tyrosine-phosphatase n=1 Tax=Confluentibacter flavum TaxID=1909700 RepID=A0A2N3HGN0_9FLAO|nr:CpsB/CapC family capsule biosynthesis tyrosine phosphatase [Confluentibacter flavum]PKQ44054.1 histidinol phosphatase [Confluentibacter flavum]
MLSIFSKKYFIKDLLEGFVDIHNHILPAIDDGAKNTEESLNLIKKLMALGIKQFIPTPHIMQDFYPNTFETIGDAYQKLLEALPRKILKDITINPAAEYMLDNHFDILLETESLYPLKGKYILVEMSYFQAPINLEDILYKLKTKGYIPVLAHPERYSFYHNKFEYYKKLKKLGCLFQLNLLSLGNHYGKSVEKVALNLLDEQLIDFVGSDVHNENHINKITELHVNESSIGKLKTIIGKTNITFTVI